MPKAEADKV